MIVRSSNLATNLLIEKIGASRVPGPDAAPRRLPTSSILRGVEDDKAFKAGINNRATAADLAVALAALLAKARSPSSRPRGAKMIEILKAQEFNEKIPAGLPRGDRRSPTRRATSPASITTPRSSFRPGKPVHPGRPHRRAITDEKAAEPARSPRSRGWSGRAASGPPRALEPARQEQEGDGDPMSHVRCRSPAADRGARAGLPGRPPPPPRRRRRRRSKSCGRPWAARCRSTARSRCAVIEQLARAADPGLDRHGRAALLRLRHRRQPARRARRRLADLDLGPERRPLRHRARRLGRRGGRGAAGCSTSSACRARPASDSPPAARWPTSPPSPPPATPCSRAPAGTSRRAGSIGAPEIDVVIGDEAHATILAALQMLGLGRERVDRGADRRAGTDAGRRAARRSLTTCAGPLIVCAQAGNVNTGAFDPLDEIADAVARARARWLHVDGAFGLWARASPGAAPTSPAAPSGPTPGRPTPTSGSTSPTTPASSSCNDPSAHRAAMTHRRRLPRPDRRRRARPVRLRPRVLPPRPRLHGLRRPALPRPRRRRRARRALLRPGPPLRRAAAGRARRRDPQRRRPQPGPRPLRTPTTTTPDPRGHRPRPGRRHLLARRHDLARHGGDADLGLELVDDGGGCGRWPRRSCAPRRFSSA